SNVFSNRHVLAITYRNSLHMLQPGVESILEVSLGCYFLEHTAIATGFQPIDSGHLHTKPGQLLLAVIPAATYCVRGRWCLFPAQFLQLSTSPKPAQRTDYPAEDQ